MAVLLFYVLTIQQSKDVQEDSIICYSAFQVMIVKISSFPLNRFIEYAGFDFTHAIETSTNGRGTIGEVKKNLDNVIFQASYYPVGNE